MQPLMKKAQAAKTAGQHFKPPSIDEFIPQNMRDTVERIVAAGVRFMYAPQTRDQVKEEIQRDAPVPQKLAEAVLGLMLTLDQQTKGGIPSDALFPAGMKLLGEATEVLGAAGQTVTQEDYNEAARTLFVLMSKKLGMKDEDIMGAAEQAAGGAGQPGAQPGAVDPNEGAEAAEGMAADPDAAKESAEAEAQAAWDEETPR